MTARTIVITGASDGIGAAAARRLHHAGATVVVIGRSPDKTESLARELGIDFFVADFADLSQVRSLAHHLRARYTRIDVLANNAGAMMARIQMTRDGFEKTYQVNYLAPFLLTTMLLDVLLGSGASVVNTTSSAQRFLGRVTPDDLQHTGRHGPGFAYALTKLAIVLFTKELHRRYHDAGLSAVAFHPGYLNTNLGLASGWKSLAFFRSLPTMKWAPTAERGADHLIRFAAGTPAVDWRPGEYYSRHKLAAPHRAARRTELGRELWQRSLDQIGDGPASLL